MNEPTIPESDEQDPELDRLVLASFQAWIRWETGTGSEADYDAAVDAVAAHINSTG
jgi:hypothetical protein